MRSYGLVHRVVYAVIFYVLLSALVWVWKPPLLFMPDGSLRRQGLMGEQETLFSFGTFAAALAVLSYYLFAVLDLVFS